MVKNLFSLLFCPALLVAHYFTNSYVFIVVYAIIVALGMLGVVVALRAVGKIIDNPKPTATQVAMVISAHDAITERPFWKYAFSISLTAVAAVYLAYVGSYIVSSGVALLIIGGFVYRSRVQRLGSAYLEIQSQMGADFLKLFTDDNQKPV